MIPAIFGCQGPHLTDAEREFFGRTEPCGVILFARNIETPDQVRDLIGKLRSATGNRDLLVLVDQEGGRVQRLGPPHWRRIPPARYFGDLEHEEEGKGARVLDLSVRRMAAELRALGFNTNCVPVLDVPVAGAHDIIGDRAYAEDAALVSKLGRIASDALLEAGILPVIKHIPGHGRAISDSHEDLPVVEASVDEMRETDWVPFQALRDVPMAMTAHVVYSAIDADNPATLSARVISDIVRGEIGFGGLLMSDDLAMKALSGPMASRAQAALSAGIDLVLHCDGNLTHMGEIAAALPVADDILKSRIGDMLTAIAAAPEADIGQLTRAYNDSLAE